MAKTYIDGRIIVNGVNSHTDVDNRRWINSLLTYATDAEAIAGIADNLVITPATLLAFIDSIGTIDTTNVINTSISTSASNGDVVFVTTGGAGITIDLPVASTINQKITVKKVDAGVGTVSIAPNGADLIEDAASLDLLAQYESATLVSDGIGKWFIIATV